MSISATASPLISKALELARIARKNCSPNPAVGCVLTDGQGHVIGEGYTQKPGDAHAEVMAIRDAKSRGEPTIGATAYVTLEPCSHHGRTGPCCDALLEAGITKVIASATDPNPLVRGHGFSRLRAAGVDVQVGDGAFESRELNVGFFKRMETGLPWVRLKIAMSLDAKTALPNGNSQWITSIDSRTDGHAWRARSDVILSGSGTVIADNPLLDVRFVSTDKQPTLAIVDSQLKIQPTAKCLILNRTKIIYSNSENTEDKNLLHNRGVTLVRLPAEHVEGNNKVDLGLLLKDLALRETNEVHVEAGGGLNGALLNAGLVDELLIYVAPTIIGNGLDIAKVGTLTDLSHAKKFNFHSISNIGKDIRLILRKY